MNSRLIFTVIFTVVNTYSKGGAVLYPVSVRASNT